MWKISLKSFHWSMLQNFYVNISLYTVSLCPLSHWATQCLLYWVSFLQRCCLHLSSPSPVMRLQLHFHLMMWSWKWMFATYLAILDCRNCTRHKARWPAQTFCSLQLTQTPPQRKLRILTNKLMQSSGAISTQTGALQLSLTITGKGLQKGKKS